MLRKTEQANNGVRNVSPPWFQTDLYSQPA